MTKELIMKNKPLQKNDNLIQTFGCRHSNPDICSMNGIKDKCAFCSDDKICKCPPKSWNKTYQVLISKKESEVK